MIKRNNKIEPMEKNTAPVSESWARMSDEELFVAYRDGETIAMEVLLGRVSKPLFRTILRRVGNRATAEDIFQDTLERIVRHRKRFDPKQSFRGWVWSIALRRCVDYFRKKGREVSLDDPDNEQTSLANPERTAIGRENLARFREALAKIPDKQQEVFFMREDAGLSFSKISEMTGRPLGTVLSQMRAALKTLAVALEE